MLRMSLVTWSMIGWHDVRLPAALVFCFGALGLFALLFLYQRRRRLQLTVEEQFKAFRERAVGLMDRIDKLRQRHKTLPDADPDFTEPMTGGTKVLYDQVSADLDRMWERWLAAMDVWNEVEQKIRSSSFLGGKLTEEASRLLSGGGLEELLRRSSLCESMLDRLNLAHEIARKSHREARRQLVLLEEAIEHGDLSSGVGDLYRREARLAHSQLEEAERMLAADPVGAEERIGGVRRILAELRRQPEPLDHRPGEGFESPSRTVLDELSVAAVRLQELASNLRLTDVVSMFIKAWVALWVLGLFLAVLPALMPLILAFMGFVVVGSGLRIFQRTASPWYGRGPRRSHRRRRW